MRRLADIVKFCDDFLNINEIEDYKQAYNGLQVTNNGSVTKIAGAVDANLLTIEQAVKDNVDCLFVHHGLFWGTSLPITGVNYQKYKLLIDNNIAVYSAHLPLDMHEKIGNNASIMNNLGLNSVDSLICEHEFHIPIAEYVFSREELKSRLKKYFHDIRSLEFGETMPKRIAVCSGGGGSLIMNKFNGSFDSVIVGEAERHFFDFLYENKLNGYVCGHYATETFGVTNLIQIVSKHFDLKCVFFNENCPL